MFGRTQWKKKDGIGFDVYGDVDVLHPFLKTEMDKINERLPDEMLKKMPEIKKKLPHFLGKNLMEVMMFFETKKLDGKVRVFVQGTDKEKVPMQSRVLFSLLMGTARQIIKTEMKEQNINFDKVR